MKHAHPVRGLVGLVAALLLVGGLACGKSRQRAMLSADVEAPGNVPPAPEMEAKVAESTGGGGPAGAPVSAAPVAEQPQKLIRTGSVSLEVKDFDAASTALGQMAKSLGGYAADTQVTRHDAGYRTGQIVLRIPAERFDAAGASIRALGKVLAEQSSVEDVTKAYADLETRLKVKREALGRIRDLMKLKAGSLKDVLEAEREISRITEEIELAEGERRFYDHQIRLSTLTVELREPVPVDLARPGAWTALGDVLRNATTLVAESLAVLLSVILVLIPWSLLAYGIYRWIRWVVRRRKAAREVKPEETKATP